MTNTEVAAWCDEYIRIQIEKKEKKTNADRKLLIEKFGEDYILAKLKLYQKDKKL